MEENNEVFKNISEIFKKSIKNEDIIDIEEMDKYYEIIKEIISKKNKNIKEWYDDDYHNNLKSLKKNSNNFLNKINNRNCIILNTSYDK